MQETPGLTGTVAQCIDALSNIVREGQERYLEQELSLKTPRDEIDDTRVTALLYFLPTATRLSDRDRDILLALGELVPTIPIMCKVCSPSPCVKLEKKFPPPSPFLAS
jgi:septin family protein